MEAIKAIIFDFGGVILDIDYGLTSKAFTQLGVKDFDRMYSQKAANLLFQKLEEGKITEEDFYKEFSSIALPNASADQIRNAWNAMLLQYRTNALDELKLLRRRYSLYLLSNTNCIHLREFTNIFDKQIGEGSLEDYFDKVYYSHEIGHRKPGREAYEWVLNENRLTPGETLFIDDSVQNIDAAKELGMQTIFLQPGTGIEELKL